MTFTDTAEAAHKAASAATYGGSGMAVYFGFTPGEWQVIGIVGGLIVGVLGLACNAGINFYFKRQHLLLARGRVEVTDEIG